MKVNVLGVQDVNFDTPDGKHIEGKNVFCSYNNSYVDGLKTSKIFIGSKFPVVDSIVPDCDLIIDYNSDGKLENVELL